MMLHAEAITVLFAAFICRISAWGYEEIFRDDFNDNTIDGDKWNRVDHAGEVNNEQQYYHPDDTWEEHGFVFLRGRRNNFGGREYTSGRLDTKDKFKFQYGEVEWRAKLPKGTGLWPALWLLQWECMPAVGCGSKWPPEIDVLEARGDQSNKITSAVHYGKWPDSNRYESHAHDGPDFTEDFHNFKVLWDPNQVVFYVDGQEVHKITDTAKIPKEEMYLVMNLAVGGDYSGNPDDSTPFPAHFIIDWVTVHRWQ